MVLQRFVLASFLVFLTIASVSAAAYAAESVTVKGEVIDTYCYSMAGAKGEGHRQCALEREEGHPGGAPRGRHEQGLRACPEQERLPAASDGDR